MYGRLQAAAITALLMAIAAHGQELAASRLLIATAKSQDPDFAKSVVLLIHYDDQGAIGLMLNRPLKTSLAAVFPDLPAAKDRAEIVYAGGPVSLGIRALLRSAIKPDGGIPLAPNIYALARKTLLERAIAAKPPPSAFRVYVGYSGWSATQLRNELSQGLWRIARADAGLVFDPKPQSLWERVSRSSKR
jgi:putative AlgH/UPF0301 family transcriptional regulator